LFEAGGPFALYSLLCRHAKVSLLPAQQDIDEKLSTYTRREPDQNQRGSSLKKFLEKGRKVRTCLLVLVLLGSSMVIGDGILTPAISGTYVSRTLIKYEGKGQFLKLT
jgi:KUP system potassium uptake protein